MDGITTGLDHLNLTDTKNNQRINVKKTFSVKQFCSPFPDDQSQFSVVPLKYHPIYQQFISNPFLPLQLNGYSHCLTFLDSIQYEPERVKSLQSINQQYYLSLENRSAIMADLQKQLNLMQSDISKEMIGGLNFIVDQLNTFSDQKVITIQQAIDCLNHDLNKIKETKIGSNPQPFIDLCELYAPNLFHFLIPLNDQLLELKKRLNKS